LGNAFPFLPRASRSPMVRLRMRTAWLKTILSRLCLVLFGLCAALVVVEVALQIAAAFMGAAPRDPLPWLASDKWRILSLGDSNTYGLYVEKSQAYPQVFETLWNAQPSRKPVEVLNLGFPGTNSSKVVKDFQRMLWTFRPDMVTIMLGGNDFWTLPETAAESPNVIDRLAAALWKRSRAYRLLFMIKRAIQNPSLKVTAVPSESIERGHGTASYGHEAFDLGWVHLPETGTPNWHPDVDLERNLVTLATAARNFGATVVFLTYPADTGLYRLANTIIRRAGSTAGVAVIDLAEAFKGSCPGGQCAELFPDQHPSVAGHRKAAQIMIQHLSRSP